MNKNVSKNLQEYFKWNWQPESRDGEAEVNIAVNPEHSIYKCFFSFLFESSGLLLTESSIAFQIKKFPTC
jgi:hypothetical protein